MCLVGVVHASVYSEDLPPGMPTARSVLPRRASGGSGSPRGLDGPLPEETLLSQVQARHGRCGACSREARPTSMLRVYLSADSQASPPSAPRQGALGQVVPSVFPATFLARILARSSLRAEFVESACACAAPSSCCFVFLATA